MVEDIGRHHFQVIKVDISSSQDIAPSYTPWYDALKGHNMAFVVFLPKMQNLNLIMKKHQTEKIEKNSMK